MKEACSRRGRRVAAAVPVPVSERSQVHIRRGGRERRAFAGERSLSGECWESSAECVSLSFSRAHSRSPHVKCPRIRATPCGAPVRNFANGSAIGASPGIIARSDFRMGLTLLSIHASTAARFSPNVVVELSFSVNSDRRVVDTRVLRRDPEIIAEWCSLRWEGRALNAVLGFLNIYRRVDRGSYDRRILIDFRLLNSQLPSSNPNCASVIIERY